MPRPEPPEAGKPAAKPTPVGQTAAAQQPPDAAQQLPESGWVAVARLLGPQGRRGELLAEPLTDLFEIFSKGTHFQLGPASGSTPVVLEDCWRPQGRNAGRLVLKLAGTDSISAAERLQGKELHLPEDAMPALDADTFFVRDLLGCALLDGDRVVGTVVDLQFPIAADGHTRLPDAADLLVVQPSVPSETGGVADSILVPFVKAWLVRIDLPTRQIVMQLPAGLSEAPALSPDVS